MPCCCSPQAPATRGRPRSSAGGLRSVEGGRHVRAFELDRHPAVQDRRVRRSDGRSPVDPRRSRACEGGAVRHDDRPRLPDAVAAPGRVVRGDSPPGRHGDQLRPQPGAVPRAGPGRLASARVVRGGVGGRVRRRRAGDDDGNGRARRRRQAGVRRRGRLPLLRVTRVALVTGARGGIGVAIVQRLEADDWTVHAVDVDDADLTTRDGNKLVVDAALDTHGRLDAIVPNAGFQHVAAVRDFPEETWDRLLALLLTSPFLLAKYAWEALAASGEGRVCVIASAHALTASPFKAGYVAAKHGVLGLVKTLALEGAEAGICATAVCPAFVRTPLMERQIPDQAKAHGMSEERVLEEVILQPHAVKRLIEPDEVAATVAFLLGPAGRGFTGVPVPLDLGWTAA